MKALVKVFLKLKNKHLSNLRENAEKLNANAVVGITVDVELQFKWIILLLHITGTAVSIVKK